MPQTHSNTSPVVLSVIIIAKQHSLVRDKLPVTIALLLVVVIIYLIFLFSLQNKKHTGALGELLTIFNTLFDSRKAVMVDLNWRKCRHEKFSEIIVWLIHLCV